VPRDVDIRDVWPHELTIRLAICIFCSSQTFSEHGNGGI